VMISAEREPKLWFWQLIVPEIMFHDFCWDAISAGTRSLLERAFWLARVLCQNAIAGWQRENSVTRKLNYVRYKSNWSLVTYSVQSVQQQRELLLLEKSLAHKRSNGVDSNS
jgi:hypothetical protein